MKKLNMNRCQLTLTAVWWGWGVLLILLLAVLSAQPKFLGDVGAAWQWFLPNLMPTMMLVGAAAYSQKTTSDDSPSNIGALFLIALLISILYLLLLTISVAGAMFAAPPIEWMTKSNYWLAPVQGLAASALGVFFTK